MTATRILFTAVLAILVTAPAQADDEQFHRVLAQCQEDWLIVSKVIDCVAERWKPHLEYRTGKRWSDPRVRVTVLEKLLKVWAHEDFLDGSPLRCADEGLASFGQLACSTAPLNIAVAPPDRATTVNKAQTTA